MSMNNAIFSVAKGNYNNIKFMETALKNMFMFDFVVNLIGEGDFGVAELLAHSYTDDAVTATRKPKLVKAANEVNERYNLNCEIAECEESNFDDQIDIERYSSLEEAVVSAQLDEQFLVQLGPDFKTQYKFIFGTEPNDKQLKAYADFMLCKISSDKFLKIREKEEVKKAKVVDPKTNS